VSRIVTSISIRLKVVLAFAVVLLCTIGLGVFALQRLDGVNNAASSIRNDSLATTRVLGDLAYHTMRLRQLEAARVLAPDAAAKVEETAKMRQVSEQAAKTIQDFEHFVGAGEERRLADQIKQLWPAYLALDSKFLTVEDAAAAAALYRGDMRALFNRFQDALQAEIAFNVHEADQTAAEGAALGSSARTGILVVLGVMTLLCVFIGASMIRGISTPISAITRAMLRLAEDDLEVQIYGSGRGDEIGSLAKAAEIFKQNAIEHRRSEAEQKERERQATQESIATLTDMAAKIEAASESALDSVGARAGTIATAADEMSASASRTGESAQGAATAAMQALANAQTVASAAEQLAASIREIGGQVSQSSAVVGRAVTAGSETRATIEALNEQVGRIGVVADMISEIAAKTNLLALNATIEAARAGDAGKGFAVVASEVKALATQTARSTEEITRHIGEVRAATGASVAAVGRIEQTIGEIDAIAGSIAAAVEEQGAATAEIARNVTETAGAANEMTRRINEVSAEAERTGQRSAQVRDDTAALNTMVGELKQSLSRVVQSSTTDVERRLTARYPVVLPCKLTVAGSGTHNAQVANLSAGGAAVSGGPTLSIGTRGTLEVERIAMKLPFVVRAVEDQTLHMAFELDAVDAATLTQTLGRLGLPLAA
jgi:methyl-accepting chemotaxis protein